jgi:hypothetical protein
MNCIYLEFCIRQPFFKGGYKKMNKKTWYAIFMGVLIFISACGKDKKGFMFFPPDAIKDSFDI